MSDEAPKAIDLFCGSGGLSLGLKMAGFDVCLGVEESIDAYLVYTLNHRRTIVLREDIGKITSINPYLRKMRLSRSDIDLVAGGPPCQGFSIANKKTRNNGNGKIKLIDDFLRFVDEIHPKAFIMENVVGIQSFDEGNLLNDLISNFEGLGYDVETLKLNAADYGVPQTRKRVFVIGTTSGKITPPKITYGDEGNKDYMTVKDAILGDLPKLNGTIGETRMKYSKPPQSEYQKQIRGTCRYLNDHITTKNRHKVTERISYIKPGESLCDLIDNGTLPESLRITVDHKSVYRRLHPKKPSVTVANYRKAMLIHPKEDRLLTIREAARLQSFPDNYRFTGRYATTGLISHMQQLVGDAVPPLLAKAVGKSLKRKIT